jgi:hypothetical protein
MITFFGKSPHPGLKQKQRLHMGIARNVQRPAFDYRPQTDRRQHGSKVNVPNRIDLQRC